MSPSTAAPGSRLRPETHTLVRIAIIAAVVVALLLWWWWPSLAADPQRTDVVVVADGQVQEASDEVARRIRERGLSVEFAEVPESWCDAVALTATAADSLSPRAIVVSVRANDVKCISDLAEAAGSASVVLAVQPGPPPLGFPPEVTELIDDEGRWIVADATPLLGLWGEARLPCQWWDDCEADGAIDVRLADGSLTPAGGERLARVIAAVLP